MDSQELIKTIEELKKAGFNYNDSDFCRKLEWFTALAARGVSSEWLLLGTGDMLNK